MKFDTSTIVAIASALVATGSATIAWLSLRTSRMNTKYSTNYTHLAQAESLIGKHPELLELHNLPKDILSRIGLTPTEAVYLIQSFTAADIYYRIDSSAALTGYRQNMLRNLKTQNAWRELIKDRFVSEGPFYSLVLRFLSDLADEDV